MNKSLFTPKVRIVINAVSFLLTIHLVLFAAKHGLPFPWVSAAFGSMSLMLIALDARKLAHDDSDNDTPAQA